MRYLLNGHVRDIVEGKGRVNGMNLNRPSEENVQSGNKAS